MGMNIFNLELFFSFHQFRLGCLMGGSHLWGVGVVGLQVLHILKWSELGKAWGDLHLDSVGSSEFQHLEGSQPLECKLLAWKLEVVVLSAEQNKVTNL